MLACGFFRVASYCAHFRFCSAGDRLYNSPLVLVLARPFLSSAYADQKLPRCPPREPLGEKKLAWFRLRSLERCWPGTLFSAFCHSRPAPGLSRIKIVCAADGWVLTRSVIGMLQSATTASHVLLRGICITEGRNMVSSGSFQRSISMPMSLLLSVPLVYQFAVAICDGTFLASKTFDCFHSYTWAYMYILCNHYLSTQPSLALAAPQMCNPQACSNHPQPPKRAILPSIRTRFRAFQARKVKRCVHPAPNTAPLPFCDS